jgi:hypothetical protein
VSGSWLLTLTISAMGLEKSRSSRSAMVMTV